MHVCPGCNGLNVCCNVSIRTAASPSVDPYTLHQVAHTPHKDGIDTAPHFHAFNVRSTHQQQLHYYVTVSESVSVILEPHPLYFKLLPPQSSWHLHSDSHFYEKLCAICLPRALSIFKELAVLFFSSVYMFSCLSTDAVFVFFVASLSCCVS
jgi:hypothetical protein